MNLFCFFLLFFCSEFLSNKISKCVFGFSEIEKLNFSVFSHLVVLDDVRHVFLLEFGLIDAAGSYDVTLL